METLKFDLDGGSRWAGMGDYQLVSPDGEHLIDIVYEGEPPHGDSFHRMFIGGRPFPGFVWGCNFAFSGASPHIAFSWIPSKWERRTVVLDIAESLYYVLPVYIYNFRFSWPTVLGVGAQSERQRFIFTGAETWVAF